jgi:putative RecB family exonuclease
LADDVAGAEVAPTEDVSIAGETGDPQADAITRAVAQVDEPYQVQTDALGASKLSTYLRCPRAYRYQYVEKIKVPSSPAAALGTAIHSVIQQIHLSRWTLDQADTVADLMASTWEEIRVRTADPDDPEAATGAVQAANEWLPWYLHWRRDQIDVAVEERWELTVTNLGPAVTLRGTIDRVYRADGKSVLSDVKSGKRAPSEQDLATDLQLSIYAWACRECGFEPDGIEIVMLRSKKVLQTARTSAYLDGVISHTVLPAAQGIAAGVFPCNPSSRFGCGYCDFQSLCPVGKGS